MLTLIIILKEKEAMSGEKKDRGEIRRRRRNKNKGAKNMIRWSIIEYLMVAIPSLSCNQGNKNAVHIVSSSYLLFTILNQDILDKYSQAQFH